jgi:hypothetical protein
MRQRRKMGHGPILAVNLDLVMTFSHPSATALPSSGCVACLGKQDGVEPTVRATIQSMTNGTDEGRLE